MFFKQYNYKPRSNSQSSQSGSGSALSSSPPKEETKTQQSTTSGPVSASIAGRRRSSAAGQFGGLSQHKRSSQDAAAGERKASWAEQKPGSPGVLSGMWNQFTKGSS